MSSPSSSRQTEACAPQVEFTPAFPVLGLYDLVIRLLVRERAWRSALLERLAPRAGELIVDAGCGTGSFLKEIACSAPDAELIGVDPDERILALARGKLGGSAKTVELKRGYLHDLATLLAGQEVAKITSSLVFHQVPLKEKRDGLAAMFATLAPGGTLLVADYGLQRTWLMRSFFRVVQLVDGFVDTQPNADGVMTTLMREAGFIEVEETDVFATATGSVSIYRASKPRGVGIPR